MTTPQPDFTLVYAAAVAVLYIGSAWMLLNRNASAETWALRRVWLLVPLVFPIAFLLVAGASTLIEQILDIDLDIPMMIAAWFTAYSTNFAAGLFLARHNKDAGLTPLRVAVSAMASAMLSGLHVLLISLGAQLLETGDLSEVMAYAFVSLLLFAPIYTLFVALGGVLSAGVVWLYQATRDDLEPADN